MSDRPELDRDREPDEDAELGRRLGALLARASDGIDGRALDGARVDRRLQQRSRRRRGIGAGCGVLAVVLVAGVVLARRPGDDTTGVATGGGRSPASSRPAPTSTTPPTDRPTFGTISPDQRLDAGSTVPSTSTTTTAPPGPPTPAVDPRLLGTTQPAQWIVVLASSDDFDDPALAAAAAQMRERHLWVDAVDGRDLARCWPGVGPAATGRWIVPAAFGAIDRARAAAAAFGLPLDSIRRSKRACAAYPTLPLDEVRRGDVVWAVVLAAGPPDEVADLPAAADLRQVLPDRVRLQRRSVRCQDGLAGAPLTAGAGSALAHIGPDDDIDAYYWLTEDAAQAFTLWADGVAAPPRQVTITC